MSSSRSDQQDKLIKVVIKQIYSDHQRVDLSVIIEQNIYYLYLKREELEKDEYKAVSELKGELTGKFLKILRKLDEKTHKDLSKLKRAILRVRPYYQEILFPDKSHKQPLVTQASSSSSSNKKADKNIIDILINCVCRHASYVTLSVTINQAIYRLNLRKDEYDDNNNKEEKYKYKRSSELEEFNDKFLSLLKNLDERKHQEDDLSDLKEAIKGAIKDAIKKGREKEMVKVIPFYKEFLSTEKLKQPLATSSPSTVPNQRSRLTPTERYIRVRRLPDESAGQVEATIAPLETAPDYLLRNSTNSQGYDPSQESLSLSVNDQEEKIDEEDPMEEEKATQSSSSSAARVQPSRKRASYRRRFSSAFYQPSSSSSSSSYEKDDERSTVEYDAQPAKKGKHKKEESARPLSPVFFELPSSSSNASANKKDNQRTKASYDAQASKRARRI